MKAKTLEKANFKKSNTFIPKGTVVHVDKVMSDWSYISYDGKDLVMPTLQLDMMKEPINVK